MQVKRWPLPAPELAQAGNAGAGKRMQNHVISSLKTVPV